MRVPAADVEELVAKAMVRHFGDPAWLASIIVNADVQKTTRLIESAKALAERISQWSVGHLDAIHLLRRLVERIEGASERIAIIIDRSALMGELAKIEPGATEPLHTNADPITISVPAHLQRRGRQVRLILGEIEAATRTPDPELVTLLREAHRWFDDLRLGRASTIAAIAKRDRQQVSHVSRTISLAFLAPDVTRMILTGRQPITLTPERLRAARPLRLTWDEQRAILV